MNSNFEHQHLDYIIFRPFIMDLADKIKAEKRGVLEMSPSNRYTAHLLPKNVREETEHERRVLTVENFVDMTIPPSPTEEDLDHYCELVLDGFPGMEIDMTPYDVLYVALETIGLFPTRLWNEKTEMAVRELERRELKLRPSYYRQGFQPQGNVTTNLPNTRTITDALEKGEGLEMYRQIYRGTDIEVDEDADEDEDILDMWIGLKRIFCMHPFVSLETLEACAAYDHTQPNYWNNAWGVDWELVIRHNPNAGPMLEWIFDEQLEDIEFWLHLTSAVKGPNAITYDYETIAQANEWLKEEIVAYFHCPLFVETWMKQKGKNPEEYDPDYFSFSWLHTSATRKRKRSSINDKYMN